MAEFDPDAYLAREPKREKKSTGFDPDAYLKKTEPESALQTFGRSTASMADSALNALTGTLDYAAYNLARAAGRSPEQATAETTSPKDVVGRAFGVAGTPGYENAPLRTAGRFIGEQLGENVVAPIAGATGLPESDVNSMVNSAMIGLGPAVPKVARAAGRAAAPVVEAGKGLASAVASPVELGQGVVGGFGGTAKPNMTPRAWETGSARMPIGDTYIPAPVLEQYRAGQITAEQAQAAARPTSELPLPALQRTQGLVPYAGQEIRAAGEQFGAGYRDPYKAAAELGADYFLGGIPTVARLGMKGYDLGRTVQAYKQLGQAGFSPMTPAESAALKNARVAGPVSPTPPAPPATLQSLRQPQKTVAPVDPATMAQQAAAEKITPPATPLQAAAQQTVAQRAQQAFGENYRAPVAETPAPAPVAGPVVPEAPRKLTLDEIMAEINKKNAPVFETAGETPPAPVDIATVRARFADQIEQQRKNMMETREQNKATYAGTETSLGKEKSQLGMGERPITADAALKKMIAASGDVKSYKNNIIVNRTGYNDLATSAGVALDWATAPDVKGMGVAEARKATNSWVYDSIKRDAPELGLGVRGETQKTAMNRANADIAWEEAQKSPEQTAQEAADIAARMERMKKMRGSGSRFDLMTDESTVSSPMEMSTAKPQVLKDQNLAVDQALENKLSKNTHDISYRMPGGLTNREIKTPNRLEIVQTDKNGIEVSHITEGTGAAKQYIRRTVDRDGNVLKSETFDQRPTSNWPRGLLEPLPKPTTTKADFLQDKMMAELSGETLPYQVYTDGEATVIVKPLQMFKQMTPEQQKVYLRNGGLSSISSRLDPAGKMDYKNMDKQLKQIQNAINKLD